MAYTPEKVAALLASHAGDSSERTSQLKEVLAGIQDETDDGLALVVEKLADSARDPSWRVPLGDSGLLDHVLRAVPVANQPRHPLNKQALRLLGNSCADCDENRARVVELRTLSGFVLNLLQNPEASSLLPFIIAATLNVCVDCQPAQLQASEAGLSRGLLDVVSGDRLSSCISSLSHIMTILELLTNQESEPKAANPNTPALLLSLATSDRYDADLDSFIEICTPTLAYLTFQDLQPVLLESGGTEVLQLAFHQLYTRFDVADLDPDTTKQLKQVGDGFLTVFADISALPGFPITCPLDSGVVQTLIDWLGLSPPLSHLQTAACLSLGNLSRSDESSIALVNRVKVPLIDILSRSLPPTGSQTPSPQRPAAPLQLTHATLSFLKNLAIAPANKPFLGAALLGGPRPLLPQLWTSTRTQPQLQFAAVSLTRLLLASCPANARRICAPLPETATSPSTLALLLSTAASADEDPIKMEAARAASLVCRALHAASTGEEEILDPSWTWGATPPTTTTTTPTDPKEQSLAAFYTTHTTPLTRALTHLLTQARFPPVRSDTIFVLALMARTSAAGARLALQVLHPPKNDDGTATAGGAAAAVAGWQALAQAIAGSDSDLAKAFTHQPRVEEVLLDDEVPASERKEEEGEEGEEGQEVSVQKLSLEPQQMDMQQSAQQHKHQPAVAAKMDRENAMVLVTELLRRFPDELAGLRRPLEAVLNKGGELVVQDRGQAPE